MATTARLITFATGAFLLAACGSDEPVPALDRAVVEPEEWLPGGATTNLLFGGKNAFSLPATNISVEHEGSFFSGNSFFNQSWVQAPASTQARDGLGPLFNARSCAGCHFKDGRGRPPADPEDDALGLLIRLSIVTADGSSQPEPRYGGQLQPFGVLGVPGEGNVVITHTADVRQLPDGTSWTLRTPSYEITELAYGPLHPDVRLSPRVAPQMIGLGLLEAVTEERLYELADPDDVDGDGISGRVAELTIGIGRFGWKAEQPSILTQVAGAFQGDIGITSSLVPEQACTSEQHECLDAASGGSPEIDDALLQKVALYSSLLAVPARSEYADDEVLRGKRVFHEVGCAKCHVPRHETGVLAELPEVSNQRIWPYTDLLLHDLGDALSDHRPSGAAQAREWRTPPLWGLGRIRDVSGHLQLLHDGRADGVAEAILFHGGEAASARDAFVQLSQPERDALIRFVESL